MKETPRTPRLSASLFRGLVVLLSYGVLPSCGPDAPQLEQPNPAGSPPATAEEELSWEIISLDRTLDGDLWATSTRNLYRSGDDGRTWDRVSRLEAHYTIVLAFPDASGAYLQCWRYRAVWDAATGETTPIENLGPAGLAHEFRRGDTWLARGYHETGPAAKRVDTSSGPSLAIPGVIGCTACSVDGGRSWTLVDSYDGAAVMAMHLADDNTLTLLLADFGVRRGRLVLDEPGGPRAEMETVAKPRRLAPPGYRLWWWVFMDGRRGWISANQHRGGTGLLFETGDRGASWKLISNEEQPVTEIHRLGDGRWLKLEGSWGEAARFFVWNDGSFVEFAPPPTREELDVRRTVVDATGDLLVLLGSGELWVYETGVDAWKLLWEEPGGGARSRD